MQKTVERIPVWKMIMYSLGQFGWSLLSAVATLLTYFYIPPETGEAAFPLLVTREAIFGMTVVGISGFLAQAVGLFFDPLMGALSDRSKSKMGRRRYFLLISSLPLAIICYLIFSPPSSAPGRLNVAWVVSAVVLFNIFMSVYRMPYGALIPELGHTSKDRMLLCTVTSVTWALGFLVGGSLVYNVKDIFQTSFGMSPVSAFRTVVAIYSIMGFVLLCLPVIFVDEKRYCTGFVSPEAPIESIKKTFHNRDFVIFTASNTVYSMADAVLTLGIVYFMTVLLGLKETWVGIFGGSMFALSFVWYFFVNVAAAKISKKKMVIFAFFLQAIVYIMIYMARQVPVPLMVWVWTIIVLQSIVAATTGIVPGAINADIIRADSIRTGVQREASFMGASSLFMKIPLALPPLVFPSLLLLGRSPEHNTGVRLAALIAFGLMATAIIILLFYNEKRTLETLAEEKAPEKVSAHNE
jgi:glycoside/pentoside/hexuronide:cation symporter, GPH family